MAPTQSLAQELIHAMGEEKKKEKKRKEKLNSESFTRATVSRQSLKKILRSHCGELSKLLRGSAVFLFFCFCLIRAEPIAYGSSQVRGRIGAVAAGLCYSQSNSGSQP